jgi:hypothetical protein
MWRRALQKRHFLFGEVYNKLSIGERSAFEQLRLLCGGAFCLAPNACGSNFRRIRAKIRTLWRSQPPRRVSGVLLVLLHEQKNKCLQFTIDNYFAPK